MLLGESHILFPSLWCSCVILRWSRLYDAKVKTRFSFKGVHIRIFWSRSSGRLELSHQRFFFCSTSQPCLTLWPSALDWNHTSWKRKVSWNSLMLRKIRKKFNSKPLSTLPSSTMLSKQLRKECWRRRLWPTIEGIKQRYYPFNSWGTNYQPVEGLSNISEWSRRYRRGFTNDLWTYWISISLYCSLDIPKVWTARSTKLTNGLLSKRFLFLCLENESHY